MYAFQKINKAVCLQTSERNKTKSSASEPQGSRLALGEVDSASLAF